MKTILVADYEKCERAKLSKLLNHCGYAVIEAEDTAQTLNKFCELKPDLVVIRIKPLPSPDKNEFDGLHLIDEILNADMEASIIITSSYCKHPIVIEAVWHGAKDIIPLPLFPNRLIESVEKLIGKP